MINYIEVDDKLFLTNREFTVVKNNERTKRLIDEENKLDVINSELESNKLNIDDLNENRKAHRSTIICLSIVLLIASELSYLIIQNDTTSMNYMIEKLLNVCSYMDITAGLLFVVGLTVNRIVYNLKTKKTRFKIKKLKEMKSQQEKKVEDLGYCKKYVKIEDVYIFDSRDYKKELNENIDFAYTEEKTKENKKEKVKRLENK